MRCVTPDASPASQPVVRYKQTANTNFPSTECVPWAVSDPKQKKWKKVQVLWCTVCSYCFTSCLLKRYVDTYNVLLFGVSPTRCAPYMNWMVPSFRMSLTNISATSTNYRNLCISPTYHYVFPRVCCTCRGVLYHAFFEHICPSWLQTTLPDGA